MRSITILTLAILILTGCQNSSDKCLEAELLRIEQELNDLTDSFEELEPIDQNGDGVQDVFFEMAGEYDYQLQDTNFDGKVDESWKFLGDLLISGKEDMNFDGILETTYLAKSGIIYLSYSDTDQNGIADLYTVYEHGQFKRTERYVMREGLPHIGTQTYDDFGHPIAAEHFETTEVTELEFEKRIDRAKGI